MLNQTFVQFAEKIEEDRTVECLETTQERQQARQELGEIFEIAFRDDPIVRSSGVNFITEMPDQMYFNPNNVIVVIRDEENGEIQGFSFIEKRDDETYYSNITAVRQQNMGYGSELAKERTRILKQKGAKFLIVQVDKSKGFANMLKQSNTTVQPNESDLEGELPHQETIKMEI